MNNDQSARAAHLTRTAVLAIFGAASPTHLDGGAALSKRATKDAAPDNHQQDLHKKPIFGMAHNQFDTVRYGLVG
jgi:hypothetical protein